MADSGGGWNAGRPSKGEQAPVQPVQSNTGRAQACPIWVAASLRLWLVSAQPTSPASRVRAVRGC